MTDEVITPDDEQEEPGADENTEEDDKTPEEEEDSKKNEDGDKGKDRKSAIAQKKFWRGKAEERGQKVATLEAELEKLRGLVKKPTDEHEAKSQEYIREHARSVFKELALEKEKSEAKESDAFESQIEDILEDNPDVSEEELLDTIEEYEVEPKTALRILKKNGSSKKSEKPKMPNAKRASADEKKAPPDDSKKSMWDVLKEETAKAVSKS